MKTWIKTLAVAALLSASVAHAQKAQNAITWGFEPQICRRRSKFEPPCRLNFEPGVEADFEGVGCG